MQLNILISKEVTVRIGRGNGVNKDWPYVHHSSCCSRACNFLSSLCRIRASELKAAHWLLDDSRAKNQTIFICNFEEEMHARDIVSFIITESNEELAKVYS